MSSQLPELKRRPGLTSWKVATQANAEGGKKLVWHESYETYKKSVDEVLESASDAEKEKKRVLPASCWPPANAKELNLEYW